MCPRGMIGDIQLETILTPLMLTRTRPSSTWSGTIHDTQPDLSVLDIGCGGGRLLGAMLSFPQHITEHISYTGCEPSESAVLEAEQRLAELEKTLMGRRRFKSRFADIRIDTIDALEGRGVEFDFVYLINVLHHVRPAEIPRLFSHILSLAIVRGQCFLGRITCHRSSRWPLPKRASIAR